MTDIAPRHDSKTIPNRRYPLRFATHRKRVDASEGKGGQPSDAPSLGLRCVGAEGDAWQSVGIAHGRRPPAFPRVPDCDGLRHIWAEDADCAAAFAGRVARRAARRATRCTRLAEETGLPAVYCTIRHDSRGSIMEDAVGAGELAAVNGAYGGDAWNLAACGPLRVADDRPVKRVGVRFGGRAVDPLRELDEMNGSSAQCAAYLGRAAHTADAASPTANGNDIIVVFQGMSAGEPWGSAAIR